VKYSRELPVNPIRGQAVAPGSRKILLRTDSETDKARKGPGGAFLGALFGIAVGYLLMPARVNWRASDEEVFAEMLWIMGSAAIGGLVGAFIAWLDRRF
jgi:hypothetical protein